MEFAKSDALTFGLELEFQIINQATGLLSPSSLEIWKNLADHEDIALLSGGNPVHHGDQFFHPHIR